MVSDRVAEFAKIQTDHQQHRVHLNFCKFSYVVLATKVSAVCFFITVCCIEKTLDSAPAIGV